VQIISCSYDTEIHAQVRIVTKTGGNQIRHADLLWERKSYGMQALGTLRKELEG